MRAEQRTSVVRKLNIKERQHHRAVANPGNQGNSDRSYCLRECVGKEARGWALDTWGACLFEAGTVSCHNLPPDWPLAHRHPHAADPSPKILANNYHLKTRAHPAAGRIQTVYSHQNKGTMPGLGHWQCKQLMQVLWCAISAHSWLWQHPLNKSNGDTGAKQPPRYNTRVGKVSKPRSDLEEREREREGREGGGGDTQRERCLLQHSLECDRAGRKHAAQT